jgi:hypothetical protein
MKEQRHIAKVTATLAVLGRDGYPKTIVRLCRNAGRPSSFYAVVAKATLCRVVPSVVGGVADETIDLFRPQRARRTFATEEAALAAAMPRHGKPRLAKLVRTLEFGPYDCPGDGPWHFSADIYKHLAGPAASSAIVRRREAYRLNAAHDIIVDVVDTSFDPVKFTHANAKAVERALKKHMAENFGRRGRKVPVALRRTIDVTSRGKEFIVKVYDDSARDTHFYSVSRRSSIDLNAGITNKPMSGTVEALEPALARESLANASPAAALKAAVVAIERLPN